MGSIPTALQSAVARMKRNPCVLRWDVDSTALDIFVESAEIALVREEIDVIDPVVGLYEKYVDRDGMTITVTVDEESADVLSALTQEGYAHSATKRGIGAVGGTALRANGVAIRVRPYATRDAATTEAYMYKAVLTGGITKAQGKSDNAFEVTFQSLADASKFDGDLHGYMTYPARA